MYVITSTPQRLVTTSTSGKELVFFVEFLIFFPLTNNWKVSNQLKIGKVKGSCGMLFQVSVRRNSSGGKNAYMHAWK